MPKTASKSMHNNGDAILPQTGTKLTKKLGSKFGALVAPSDAIEKNRNIDAQLQSILHTTAQKDLGKFTSCRTFGAHKLVHSEPFLDYDYLYEF